jgi:hypothetical protein
MSSRPSIDVAVVMRRERVQGDMAKWQTWRWVLDDVTPQSEGFGTEPKCLRESEEGALWLFPHFKVELFPDDAEGYFVQAVEAGCYSVDSYFLHKTSGEETSLTRVPILVDGAVIPQGTLCYVKKSGDTIEWVKPVRLTLFNLPLDGEGSEVFRHHLDKMGDARGDNDAAVHAVYRLLHEKS